MERIFVTRRNFTKSDIYNLIDISDKYKCQIKVDYKDKHSNFKREGISKFHKLPKDSFVYFYCNGEYTLNALFALNDYFNKEENK